MAVPSERGWIGNRLNPGDGGIDGIINEDKLGLDSIYLQAKSMGNTLCRSKK